LGGSNCTIRSVQRCRCEIGGKGLDIFSFAGVGCRVVVWKSLTVWNGYPGHGMFWYKLDNCMFDVWFVVEWIIGLILLIVTTSNKIQKEKIQIKKKQKLKKRNKQNGSSN